MIDTAELLAAAETSAVAFQTALSFCYRSGATLDSVRALLDDAVRYEERRAERYRRELEKEAK